MELRVGMRVWTLSGAVPVERLAVGTRVWGFDEAARCFVPTRVVRHEREVVVGVDCVVADAGGTKYRLGAAGVVLSRVAGWLAMEQLEVRDRLTAVVEEAWIAGWADDAAMSLGAVETAGIVMHVGRFEALGVGLELEAGRPVVANGFICGGLR